MLFDCMIIGGGPAGLNAALVLGRARRSVILFDNNQARNAVAKRSHGFITRDGTPPSEFRKIAHQELSRYASVRMQAGTIQEAAIGANGVFWAVTEWGEVVHARKVMIATGLKEMLPAVRGIRDYYGKSLFSCPYCEGWELRDRSLVLISENGRAFHMAKTVHHWSKQLVVCTNGKALFTTEQRVQLQRMSIKVYEQRISSLIGDAGAGDLAGVQLEDGSVLRVQGGFVTPDMVQTSIIGQSLGCRMNPQGLIETDGFGRTSVRGVYVGGDASLQGPSQVVIAAAEGSKAAISVNADLIDEDLW